MKESNAWESQKCRPTQVNKGGRKEEGYKEGEEDGRGEGRRGKGDRERRRGRGRIKEEKGGSKERK